jgi:hydroxymethylglutaryl-CoA synthase
VTTPASVGISDLSVYVPEPMVEVDAVIRRRILDNPRMNRHFQRAVRVTGQEAIRFPEPWQDSATLAAEAARGLFAANAGLKPHAVRHLAVGTESTMDLSKPISSMVYGMLRGAGVPLSSRISSFQTQHACAGGTVALLSVAGLLATGGKPGDAGIVVSTDVARYEAQSTAEVTQGAGAVAIALDTSPRLVELDMAGVGYSSHDVDDFFRPVGSTVARVQGSYSMKCYEETLTEAFLDHCERSGQSPEESLDSTDIFVLHTPFRLMPVTALTGLVRGVLGLDDARAERFLASRGFQDALAPMGRIGNMYTGSMWAVLAFSLRERLTALGQSIVGRRVLFASYGSGNTMMVFSGTVAPGAPEVIRRWDLDRIFRSARGATWEEYEAWLARDPYAPPQYGEESGAVAPPNSFYLAGVREDGYRLYAHTASAPGAKGAADRNAEHARAAS